MSMSAATEQIIYNELMRVRKCGKYSPHESNYERLFGTPERAARIVADMCDLARNCSGCPFYSSTLDGVCGDYDALVEWLRGDAK